MPGGRLPTSQSQTPAPSPAPRSAGTTPARTPPPADNPRHSTPRTCAFAPTGTRPPLQARLPRPSLSLPRPPPATPQAATQRGTPGTPGWRTAHWHLHALRQCGRFDSVNSNSSKAASIPVCWMSAAAASTKAGSCSCTGLARRKAKRAVTMGGPSPTCTATRSGIDVGTTRSAAAGRRGTSGTRCPQSPQQVLPLTAATPAEQRRPREHA